MISLPGYKITKEICRGNRRYYLEALREQDLRPVMIKTHFSGPEAATDRVCLQHEYELLKNVKGIGIPVLHGIENYPNGVACVMDSIDGILLSDYMRLGQIDLSDFLKIAISTTEVLCNLHRQNIIHKDIQPENLFINKHNYLMWVVDFRVATLLPREKPKHITRSAMEGSLAYMSPEQTGRMNRNVDYRTDFYSLGVLLYHILTGRLPFEHKEALELVHHHLAKQPDLPENFHSAIPGVISEIIMKLLSKNAEDRYLSGQGLIYDLKQCQQQYETLGRVDRFVLAEQDYPEKLRISQKIYGRDQEIEKLIALYEKASQGNIHMAVISGEPGVGKTSLVLESYKPITLGKGYFLVGKFDPFYQNVPYGALVLAFQELIKQLLVVSEENLRHMKVRLLSALGIYGQIIIDVIPEMELVIGPQAPVKKVHGVEARNRFNRVMMDFVGVFCDPKHPLAIFLDDLQWVDIATLKLIEGLMTESRIQHLFLIVSYRDNEIAQDHPLFATIKKLEQENCNLLKIHLNPLDSTHIFQLITDTLQRGKGPVGPLAELLMGKTGGNPFFVNQFLIMLEQEKLLVFNAVQSYWEWNLSDIRSRDITDNVVELLLNRLRTMPLDTQKVMMIAACIGSTFDLKTLQTITGYSDSEILTHLAPAIQEELVVTFPKDAVGRNNKENLMAITEYFKFRHDRVRQASYALIADEDKKSVHLKIGTLLFNNISPQRYEENIFDMIHHLNIASDLICDRKERDETAEMNLIAGNKAMSLTAFEPAFRHYAMGLRLLDDKGWKRQYRLTLKLYTGCAEAARLCGDYKETVRIFDVVIQNAKTDLDRVDIYQSRILSLISEDHRMEALDMTRQFLKEFDIDLPAQPTLDNVHKILEQTMADLSGTNIEDLADLPEMTALSKLAAAKIMGSIFATTYQMSREWFLILICQQVRISFVHGNFSNSAIAYSGFGVILCGHVGDIENGYRFGCLGMQLLNRFEAKELEAKVCLIFYAGINHWKFHLRDSIEALVSAYYIGLETGDYEIATYCTYYSSYHSLLCGNSLEDIERQMTRYTEEAIRHNQMQAIKYFAIFHQVVLNLLGENETPERLVGRIFNKTIMEPMLDNQNDTLALFFMHFCKALLYYLFDLYPQAIKHVDLAGQLAELVPGNVVVAVCNFYDSLSRLAMYETFTDENQKQTMVRVEANQFQMKKWMEYSPANFAHKFYLVEAEIARVLNQDDKAIHNFDISISLAGKSGYDNEQALANELAAKFWLSRDHHAFAGIFMQRAYAGYAHWGAFSKVEYLYGKYHHMLSRFGAENSDAAIETSLHKNHQLGRSHQGLDFATLMKAYQAISSEIVLDNLLDTMMKIVIENAGAEKGFLLLNSEDRLRITASGVVDSEEIVVQSFESAPDETEKLSLAVVNYAARIRECVVLKNAVTDGQFGNDPYIRKNLPKSVLCIPIIYQSKLTGVIYLENRLTADVFSPDRIEVLRLLTSQIGISIENTMLFEKLRKAEEQYRGIYENSVEGIFLSTVEGRIVSANPSMAQILGYNSSEELCQNVTDIERQLYVTLEQRNKMLRMLQKNETVADFEVEFRRKDGESLWVSLSARSIYDENGEMVFIEGFIVDVSERKAATDALREREQNLRKENIRLRSDIKDRFRFGRIIGKSPAMQEVYELILKAATTDTPVIIDGESGTGKELVAKEIHEKSDRKKGNFVPVNCGAIPENLFESEFFGYKKGAFTGANKDQKGYLDQSQDGSLFLDELGEISLLFQVKLLRALEGTYTPLGSQTVKKSNARIVAATNRDLKEAIRKGAMREDFYYRINIVPIHLPPLRSRKEDIPLLIEHFWEVHSRDKNDPPVTGKILEELLSYDWPGNVRELQNVLQRYCTLGTIDFLSNSRNILESPGIVPREIQAPPLKQGYPETITETEKVMIIEALERFKWNKSKAALQLGVSRRTFYRKLKKYQLI